MSESRHSKILMWGCFSLLALLVAVPIGFIVYFKVFAVGPLEAKIPKRSVPPMAYSYRQEQVDALYSIHAVDRARGAYNLSVVNSSEKDVDEIIPLLIAMLDDEATVSVRISKELPTGGRLKLSGANTTPASEALNALKKITEQKFGKNEKRWKEWWEAKRKKMGS